MNLMDELTEKIVRHLCNLDLVHMASEKLLRSCVEGDIDQIEFFSKNRGRLVNFVQSQQNDIEKMIDDNATELSNEESINLLKCWINDIAVKTSDIANLDDDILELLDQEKTKTSQEIASTFKTKDAFKGYNLNKVR